ncbi:hemin uptake protein HemP [Reyranella sp. CPCC 100927]|uniref:hemin uptake protein HemP n=1 Tax=Reyranella sp. CPCC 100927 TaxID=2599616 RepID=UPI0021080FA8|nr:hemin uptake protein HemP [Reyranella sp. CPCC 100927]
MHQANTPPNAMPRSTQYARPPRAPSIRRVGSRELMGPSGQLIIRHAGDEYRLRVTSKGKLILTK